MLQQDGMIERVRQLCHLDERLVAAMMYGSFALSINVSRMSINVYARSGCLHAGHAMMPDETKSPWKTIASKQIYDNPWIAVREDQVIRPDGEPGIYGVVHYKNIAVG